MRQPIRSSICFAALTVLSLLSSAVFAQTSWSGPYTPAKNGSPTVGSYLEGEFSAILKQCTVDKLIGQVRRYGLNHDVELSAVPQVLQSELSLDRPTEVRAQFDQSGASLFAYVTDRSSFDGQSFDQSRYLVADLVADPQTFFPNGWSTTVYKHNCASIVTAAANASSGMSLPWAAAKAALTNEFKGSQITSIELASGRFNSPLRTLLLSLDQSDQLFGNFAVWQWYVNNPTAVAKANYYMAAFDGLILFRTEDTARSYDGKVSLQGSLNAAGIASASSNIAADLTNADHTQSKRYSTAFLVANGNVPNPQMIVLPTVDDALNAITRARATQQGPYDQVLKSGVTNKVTYSVAGLPGSLCGSTTGWRTETDTDAKFSAAIDSVSIDGTPASNGKATCRFVVGITPDAGLLSDQSNLVRLSYRLVTAGAVGNKHAKIEAQPVQFTTTRAPYLIKKSYSDSFRATSWQAGGDSGYDLTWEVPIGIDEGNDPIDWKAAITPSTSPNNPQLTCAGRPEPIDLDMQSVLPSAGTAGGTGSVTAVLSRRVYAREGVDPKADAPCTLSGSIRIRMAGTPQRTVTRPFPSSIELRYPKAVQTSPVTQTGPPSAPPSSNASQNAAPSASNVSPPPGNSSPVVAPAPPASPNISPSPTTPSSDKQKPPLR